MYTPKRIGRILTALILAVMLLSWSNGSLNRTAQAACPVTAENWHEVGTDSACAGGISNNSGNSMDPSLAIAPGGTPYVAWWNRIGGGGDYEIYVRRWNGSSWVEVGTGSASGGGISNNGGYSEFPSLAIAPDGAPYVAWDNGDGAYNEIYVRRWNGSSWAEVGTGSASGGGISNNGGSWEPSLAIAPDGTPYVAWHNIVNFSPQIWEIYVKRWNGSTWAEVGTGSASGGGISNNGGTSRAPSIAVAPDGTPYIAWHDSSDGDYEIYVRRWNGSSWVEVGTGSASGGGISNNSGGSGYPSVAVAPDGTPYVAWHDSSDGDWEIYVKRWNGSNWVEVGTGSATGGGISDNSLDSNYPSLAIASDGAPYVTWHDPSVVWHPEIYVRRWNGNSWEETGAGSATGGGISDSGSSVLPSVAIAPDGTPYVAWYDDSSGNDEIYTRRWQGGGVEPDIGFRPNPDGYKFPNYRSSYPLPPADRDYTTADMRQMFGDDCVCRIVGPVCFVKWQAIRWNYLANRVMNGGHCDGMASTSLRFFKGLDNPSDFQGGANTTHDLDLGNARRHIAYYFVEQLTDPVKAYEEQVRHNTPSAILSQLRLAMLSPIPAKLFMREGCSGHAITPYAIEDRGNGVYWVKVYDNNYRDDANRHVEINTTNNTWSYNLGGSLGTWSGDANTHSLGILPISEYAKQPLCPEWRAAADELAVWLSGEGHLLITDSHGRRIGYVGSQFVNEIPGAYESIVDGGLGVEMEPIYTLPLIETYTISLDGQTLTQTETVEVTQFGPGYATWVDDVILGPTSQDQLTIASDGTQLVYRSSGDKEATLALALDGASENNQLQVNGADIGAGQVVTLTADVDNGQLVFNNAQASGGEYDLEVRRVSAAGEQRFAHAGLIILATDTHYADYGAWDGSGPMTLHVDHGSDGMIDETLELDNQAGRIYLPIILKSY